MKKLVLSLFIAIGLIGIEVKEIYNNYFQNTSNVELAYSDVNPEDDDLIKGEH